MIRGFSANASWERLLDEADEETAFFVADVSSIILNFTYDK